MVQIAFDANVLVYAEIDGDSERGRKSIALLGRSVGGIIPAQAFGEALRVAQRKAPAMFPAVIGALEVYRRNFRVPPTTDSVIAVAAEIARERKLQFWDCVICVAAAQTGAKALFTEDMQDGSDVQGLRILNPFDAKNDALIEELVGT